MSSPAGNVDKWESSSDTLDKRDRYAIQRRLLDGVGAGAILDVGAHTGRTAEEYRKCFPDAQIHCFEACSHLHEGLARKNAGDPLVHVHFAAVHERSGTADFFLNKIAATSSLLPREEQARRYFSSLDGTLERRSVPTVCLDDFCSRHGIARVNILKLDIQGGEKFALRGASVLLAESRIDLIFTEVFFVEHYRDAMLFHELTQHLAQFGYTLYDLFIDRHGKNGQVRFGDALYISAPMRRQVVDQFSPEP